MNSEKPAFSIWSLFLWVAIVGSFVYYFKNCRGTKSPIDIKGQTVLQKKRFKSGVSIEFGKNSIENDVINFIEDPQKLVDKNLWFNFRNLKFKLGSAEIDSTSLREVENIAAILQEYPNVHIKIGGYTDNIGNEASNLQLSTLRASNVEKALIAKGIDALRLEFEGYGSLHALATNDTEEGRKQNRRIAIRIDSK